MKARIHIILTTVLLSAMSVCGQNSADNESRIKLVENSLMGAVQIEGESGWNILDRMRYYGINGVSIAVIQNYKMEWAKGYGWADAALRIPVTSQTLFQAASISKSLNAVGLLKLVQEKKLNPDADINTLLVSWKFPYDSLSKNKKITVNNLLSHTGGLNVHGFPGYAKGEPLPTVIQILDGTKPANSPAVRSMYEPNSRSEYSGGGITISQLILTDITHQPYERYMEEQVLKPLGMTASTFAQPPVNLKPEWLATGYDRGGKEIAGKFHIYPEQAAAGLWTNPADLSKYIIETQLSYEGKSQKVLDQMTTRLRLTPYLDGKAALGVFIDDFNSTIYFEHSGSNEGFMSQYYGSLSGGNGLVVMVNSDNGAIIREIVNSIAKTYQFKGLYRSKTRKKIPVDVSSLQAYTGKYTLPNNFGINITRSGDSLFVQAVNQPKFQIFAEGPDKFFLTIVDAEIEFVKDASGKVSKLLYSQDGGRKQEGKKSD